MSWNLSHFFGKARHKSKAEKTAQEVDPRDRNVGKAGTVVDEVYSQ
jgi:hypothetical protein